METGLVGQAVGMFAVTNIDDIVILALFFGQNARQTHGAARVVVGQYLGFAAILTASIGTALGVGLLPDTIIAYCGLLPLLIGFRAAWRAWHERHADTALTAPSSASTVTAVAAITFANGGDNIGVYLPVFASVDLGELVVFVMVFLVLVGIWCLLGRFFATRPVIAGALARWGHILLPIVLIGIGLFILIEGNAFGL